MREGWRGLRAPASPGPGQSPFQATPLVLFPRRDWTPAPTSSTLVARSVRSRQSVPNTRASPRDRALQIVVLSAETAQPSPLRLSPGPNLHFGSSPDPSPSTESGDSGATRTWRSPTYGTHLPSNGFPLTALVVHLYCDFASNRAHGGILPFLVS